MKGLYKYYTELPGELTWFSRKAELLLIVGGLHMAMNRDKIKKTITGAAMYFVVFTLFMFFVMGERNIPELIIIGVVSSMIIGFVLFYFQKKSHKK